MGTSGREPAKFEGEDPVRPESNWWANARNCAGSGTQMGDLTSLGWGGRRREKGEGGVGDAHAASQHAVWKIRKNYFRDLNADFFQWITLYRCRRRIRMYPLDKSSNVSHGYPCVFLGIQEYMSVHLWICNDTWDSHEYGWICMPIPLPLPSAITLPLLLLPLCARVVVSVGEGLCMCCSIARVREGVCASVGVYGYQWAFSDFILY